MTHEQSRKEKLFSYGTLQQEAVQLETFGRLLEAQRDVLKGYQLADVKITDPEVIALSGKEIHKILIQTGLSTDQVEGAVFELTSEELYHSDVYEVKDYKRVEVILGSGMRAWAYVSASVAQSEAS